MEERLARSTALRAALFAVLSALLVWPMLHYAAYTNEFRDAQVLGIHERVAALSVTKFHQVPLWDPYYCGGLYGLGAPQSRFASPAFLATLLFGVERAQPIIIFLLAVLGMEGTYRWLRLRVPSASAALRIAPVFALSGHFAVSIFRGWTSFFGFELLPFVLLGVTLATRGRTRGLFVAAFAFAFILGFGGTFAAPLVAIAASVEGLRALSELPRERRRRGAAMLAAAAVFMAAVSAVRLWPVGETLSAAPRIMAGTPGHLPRQLFGFLWQSLDLKAGDVTDAGSFHVGPLFLALVALGGADRRSARSLVATVLFVWLAAGYARKPALFALLRELPVFSALRYPERFLWIAVLFASEPAANALARVPLLGDTRRWRIGASIVLSAAVVVTVGLELRNFWRVADARTLGDVVEAQTSASRQPSAFRQARGNRWLAAHYEGVGAGSLSCWETHPVLMSPNLRGDLEAEEYLADGKAGAVTRASWSPNELGLRVSLSKPTRVVVNQNWHPGWQTSKGTVVSEGGLLAVALPEGAHVVTLTFRPLSAWGGGVVTLVALVALVVLGLRARRGRSPFGRGNVVVTACLVLAPLATFATLFMSSREPRFPPPPQRNANGSPAIVASVEKNAEKPDRSTFPIAVELEGARVSPIDDNGNIRVDLYFRRKGSIPRTTALFAHVERRENPVQKKEDQKDFYNLDHQVVGGSFYLSDAPENELVHDVFGTHLGKAASGVWDVKVGFGHFSGRRTKSDDLVRIGTFTIP